MKLVVKIIFIIALFLMFYGCNSEKYEHEKGVMTISKEQTQSWVRNFIYIIDQVFKCTESINFSALELFVFFKIVH